MRLRGRSAVMLGPGLVVASFASARPKAMAPTGTWVWKEGGPGCADNPHTIMFTDNRKLMEITMHDRVKAITVGIAPIDPLVHALWKSRGASPSQLEGRASRSR